MKDYYVAAKVACYKVRVSSHLREDAVQFIVMKLWENDLPVDLDFKTLVTYGCNKAKDYLRSINGWQGGKTQAAEMILSEEVIERLNYNPEQTLINKIAMEKIPQSSKQLLEAYINGEKPHLSEGRVSQIIKAFHEKEFFNEKIRRKTK
jgi:hypothetical protein